MTQSLRGRLFVTDVLVVAIAIGLVTAVAGLQQRRWFVEQHATSLERAAREVAGRLDAGVLADPQGFAGEVGSLTGYRVTLIAGDGRVIGDSDVPADRLAALENHAGRPEVRTALAGGTGRATRRSASIDVELLYIAVPGRDSIAVVRLAEPLRSIAALDRSLWRLSLGAALLAGLLSMPFALWIAGRQSERIRALERAAQRLGAGDRTARAAEQPADELGRLGAAINAMAAELRARVAALEREGEERDRILLHMRDGVALIDESGHVVRMNRSLASILGVIGPATPGTPFPEFVRSPELDELLRQARAGGQPVETDLRLWSPGPRLVHATATPLGDSGRRAVLLVLHDLTEIERLDRVRQDFVANVSHELRTPLTSLRGYAETLLEGGLEDGEHREGFVRVIRDQASRLEALVDDLLSLAELERPGFALRPRVFSWGEMIRAQVELARPAAERKGLTLGIEGEDGPAVSAERARIEAVVANLVDNAIKYTEQGGVRVRWGSEPSRAWLEVEDTGPGIPEEDQPRVFERFYRVDKARSRAKGGTGLGLSIVKHIAAVHGGEVSVRSTPGAGSTFRFEIPRDPAGGTRT
jgi:two-component system phosphate regulon sensor histidine kinase PhoR